MQNNDYGSVATPASPLKHGKMNLMGNFKQQRNTEVKQLHERRTGTAAARKGSQGQARRRERSTSVQQANGLEIDTKMMRTAP